METVTCNLCGSDRYKLVYRKPDLAFFPDKVFSVVECTQCGLGFVNPRPTEAETPKYYPEAYYGRRSGRRRLIERFSFSPGGNARTAVDKTASN